MCSSLIGTGTAAPSVQSCTLLYMSSISVTDARGALSELLARVAAGEEVTLTRHGQPVAVVLRPDSLRARRLPSAIEDAHELGRRLAAARLAPVPAGGLSVDRAEVLVAAVRESRERG